MPSSYTGLRYHLIFSTKNRVPQINPSMRDRLHEYLGGIVRDEKGRLIAAGGTPDHVYLLISTHPQTALSDLLRQTKASSSRWIHETFADLRDFGWQDGYGAFTVSHSNVGQVTKYIAEQEEHLRRVSFQEEFIEFLRRHDVPYDERYIWR
ncbi:MAG: IS200/IS605 family transposase [Planctomycetes bacterium]|nr:IS200/IS605 family transposase [Planctomycetota bacterium]